MERQKNVTAGVNIFAQVLLHFKPITVGLFRGGKGPALHFDPKEHHRVDGVVGDRVHPLSSNEKLDRQLRSGRAREEG